MAASAHAIIKAHDISDSAQQPCEAVVEQQPESMQVVGQCPGDKRKRHDVLAAEAEAAAERAVAEKKRHCDEDSSTAMEAQVLGWWHHLC